MKRTRLQCDIIIFKRCRAKARRVILEAKTSSCQQYCSSLTNNSNLFHVWQVIKSFSGQRSSSHIPTLVANGISGKNNQNKAQDKQSGKPVRSLQQSFKLHSAFRSTKRNLRHTLSYPLPQDPRLNQAFSIDELLSTLKDTKNQRRT